MNYLIAKTIIKSKNDAEISVHHIDEYNDKHFKDVAEIFNKVGIEVKLDDDFIKRINSYNFLTIAFEGIMPVGIVTARKAEFIVESMIESQIALLTGIVVIPEFQGSELAKELVRLADDACSRKNLTDLWHFQACVNWRAYLLALTVMPSFVPQPGRTMTKLESEVMDAAGAHFYGSLYQDGLVAPPPGSTSAEMRIPIDPAILAANIKARYFSEINPKYVDGFSLGMIRYHSPWDIKNDEFSN